MGFCTRRHFLLVILVLQMVATIERQVFDFLGFMWAPILANFFQMVFVIFGFFGAYQYRSKYIIAFCIWSIVWIGWNIFIICFYLNVGVLNRDGDALNMGTGSTSWWEVNGAGCRPSYASPTTSTSSPAPTSPSTLPTLFPSYATGDDVSVPFETVLPSIVTLSDSKDDFAPYRPLRPSSVTGCLLQYEHVEVLHAAIHCLLAALAMSAGVCLTHGLLSEDDNSRNKARRSVASSLYSIEYSSAPHCRSSTPDTLDETSRGGSVADGPGPPAYPFGAGATMGVATAANNNSNAITNPLSRPMTPRRVKRRSVTRTSTRHNPARHSTRSAGGTAASRAAASLRASLRSSSGRTASHVNPVARLIDHPRGVLCPPHHGDSSSTEDSAGRLAFGHHHTLLLPQYRMQIASGGGHSNPTYQSSQPGSTLSLDADSNRPPSARSSYSNYHGQRRQPVASLGAGRATGQVPVSNTTSTFSHHRSSQVSSSTLGGYGYESGSAYLHGLDSETVI